MKFYESSASTQAPPEKVWAILTDASGHPEIGAPRADLARFCAR